MELTHYKDPPIIEVICGFVFDPIPGLDPLSIGWFARERRDDFPKRSIQPALVDPGTFYVGSTSPLRAWLISADDAFLLQIQHDRFYVNWRAKGSRYPSFNDHGEQEGILTRAMRELSLFQRFCREALEQEVTPTRVELAKVDRLVHGTHWQTQSELLRVLPALAPLAALCGSEEGMLAAHFTRSFDGGQIIASITMGEDEGRSTYVNLEWRSLGTVSGEGLEDTMRKHNAALNDLFDNAIPKDRREALFRGVVE